MTGTTDALVLDLVEWVAREPRLYSEVIETWRTSCPRLTIWEDAVDRGYVARQPSTGRGRAGDDHRRRREVPARQRPLIRRGPPVTQISVNVCRPYSAVLRMRLWLSVRYFTIIDCM